MGVFSFNNLCLWVAAFPVVQKGSESLIFALFLFSWLLTLFSIGIVKLVSLLGTHIFTGYKHVWMGNTCVLYESFLVQRHYLRNHSHLTCTCRVVA